MNRICSNIVKLFAICMGCTWVDSLWALFGGKTELELNGIGVIKESAEILAKTVETFPTKSMALAIIGFIMVSQGLFFFARGLTSVLCGEGYRPDGKRVGRSNGFVQCLIGIALAAGGSFTSLYSAIIVNHIFGL